MTFSASQLRINQRIYRVALLRARALADRLAGRVTGGDMAPGALDAGALVPGLAAGAAGPVASAPPSSVPAPVPPRRRAGTVTLSVRQLRINQRIAQAAVRVANDAVAVLERGLTGSSFADGSIGSDALEPGATAARGP